MLKKGIFTAFAFMLMSLLASCSSSRNLTQQEDIVKLFHDNEDIILSAIESNDFTKIEDIQGIQKVYISEEGTYIDFSCGGEGFGPNTSYYGFFYSPDDDKAAWNGGICPDSELAAYGEGYRWQEKNGDNVYYVEEIAVHFFYYHASF